MVGDQPGFGAVLRRYRTAAGLTQQALAERAGLSLRGVSDLERGLRRVPYPHTVERLAEALGLGAAEQAELRAARRRESAAAQEDGALPLGSPIPVPLTSFVGRQRELGELRRLLGMARLVTLTGAGGVGKTRLAIEAARQHDATFADGVQFVALAGVGSPSLLASAIATGLGVPSLGSAVPLVRYLRDKHLLLLLDSFEHLLDGGTSVLTDILSGAPAVTMLVTSRERLNLQEEWVLLVEGLPVPDREAAESIDQYPAVQLFVQRARQVQAHFSLADHAQPVIDICQHVEGMPLALELAATWLRVMPCDHIALEIERGLDFLTTPVRNVPDRHRSLRAVFDRSWSLLSDVEQRVLAQLSIFRGGFNLEAAEQVAGASLFLLARLADKSLIRVSASGRYDLHELVRQYLSDKLVESGDRSAVARRHFDFVSTLAEQAETQLYGPDQEVWYDRLEIDYDNLGAALAWALKEQHAEAGLRLAGALGFFWILRTHLHDGYEWLQKFLQIDPDTPGPVRAKALRTAGFLSAMLGNLDKGVARCEESLVLARAAGDRWNIAWSLADLGFLLGHASADVSDARGLLEEALQLFRALGDGWGISHALRRLGWILILQGDYARAATLLEEALTLARHVQNKHAVCWSLFLLGNVVWFQTRNYERTMALYRESSALITETRDEELQELLLLMSARVAFAHGDCEEAESRYAEVVAHARELGGIDDRVYDLSPVVAGFAQLAIAGGEPLQGARLFGAAHVLLAAGHWVLGDRGSLDLEPDVAATRAQLGEAAFAAAFAEGRAMTLEQAFAYALRGRELKPAPA